MKKNDIFTFTAPNGVEVTADDELLKVHESMDYPLWEQNIEAEIQGIFDR